MTHNFKYKNWYAKIVVALLVIVLFVLCLVLVRQYRIIMRQEAIAVERVHFSDLVHNHPLSATDAHLIESWMTFNYVSVSFKVPTSYLREALGVSSSTSAYPNITIGHYARTIATSSADFTESVRNVVEQYLAPTGE